MVPVEAVVPLLVAVKEAIALPVPELDRPIEGLLLDQA